MSLLINQLIYQSTIQSINQPINQSTRQSTNPTNQPTNQSMNASVNQPITQPINQSNKQASSNQRIFPLSPRPSQRRRQQHDNRGQTYVFDQQDDSNWFHPLGFAYFPDGAHEGVDELEEGVGNGERVWCASTFFYSIVSFTFRLPGQHD